MNIIKNNIKQHIKRLLVKKDGAAAVEFALIAPVFFLLMMAIVEVGLIMFAESMLEGALAHGARISKTGFTIGERQAYIKSEVVKLSGAILDPDQLVVEALNYDTHANINQPEPCITALCEGGAANIDYRDVNGNNQWDEDQGTAGPGIRNRIVLYKATYTWPIFTPVMANLFGNANGDYEFSSTTIVKNEDY